MANPAFADYAVVLDAGSSGTRMYGYEWNVWRKEYVRLTPYPTIHDENLVMHQKFKYKTKGKFNVGIHTISPGNVAAYLDSLIVQRFPRKDDDRKKYTLIVMATGGMRSLKLGDFNPLDKAIGDYVTGENGFNPLGRRYETVTGKQEGLYGWVAANYLVSNFPKAGIPKGRVDYLEMGGQTVQIAFRSAARAAQTEAAAKRAWAALLQQGEQRLNQDGTPRTFEDLSPAHQTIYRQECEAYSALVNHHDLYPSMTKAHAVLTKAATKTRVAMAIGIAATPWVPANFMADAADAFEDGVNRANIAFERGRGEARIPSTPLVYKGPLLRVRLWDDQFDLYLATYTLGSDVASRLHEEALEGLYRNGTVYDPSKPDGWPTAETLPELLTTAKTKSRIEGKPNLALCEHFAHLLLERQAKQHERLVLQTLDRAVDDVVYTIPDSPIPAPLRTANLLAKAPDMANDSFFVGGSTFYYTMRSTFGRDRWGKPRDVPHRISELELEFQYRIITEWKDIEAEFPHKDDPAAEKFLVNAVFTATWVTTILREALNFQPDESGEIRFQPYNGPIMEAKDTRPEMSWTLGVIFIEACQRARRPGEQVLQVIGPWDDGKAVKFQPGEPKFAGAPGADAKRGYMPDVDATDNEWNAVGTPSFYAPSVPEILHGVYVKDNHGAWSGRFHD